MVILNVTSCYHASSNRTSAGGLIDRDDDGRSRGEHIAFVAGTRASTGGILLLRKQRLHASVADVVNRLVARGELTELKAK